MNISTIWYKQAICFAEWAQKNNAFGDRMCCQLYLNQLLTCKGIKVLPYTINTNSVLNHFCANWDNQEFSEQVRDYFREDLYDLLEDNLFHRIANFFGKYDLDYEPYDVQTYCRNYGRIYVAPYVNLDSLLGDWSEPQLDKVVPMMCKYLTVEDLNEYETVSDLIKKLDGILHTEPVRYTPTFKDWCRNTYIQDMAAEHDRLMKLYNVTTDQELDKYIQMNMV